MKTKDFEKRLQKEVDKDITIRTNPNHNDIAGVYYQEQYLGVAVPPITIKKERDENYVDKAGFPYKHEEMAFALVKGQYEKFKEAMENDPNLFKDD